MGSSGAATPPSVATARRGARSGRRVLGVVASPGGLGAAVPAVLVLALAACDPCTGVVGCVGTPRVGVSGQIVDRGMPTDADRDPISGASIPPARPVAGARVEVTRVGGVEVASGSASATTDATGWWQVSLPASAEGDVAVDVRVTAPGAIPYVVRGVAVRASRERGDGTVLGRWTREPYITELGEIYDAASGARVDGAAVTAVRRGGVAVEPTANTRSPMVTAAGGRFLYDVRPLADGPLVLDLTVERSGVPPVQLRGVTVNTRHEWLPINVNGSLIFRL